MSKPLSQRLVPVCYQDVINNVISNARELFLEEDADLNVLDELKHNWEKKIAKTKAVYDHQAEKLKQQALGATNSSMQVINQQRPTRYVMSKLVTIKMTLPKQSGSDLPANIITIRVPETVLQHNGLAKLFTGPILAQAKKLPQHLSTKLLQGHVNATFKINQPFVSNVKQNIVQTDGAHALSTSDDDNDEPIEVELVLPKLKKNATTKNVKVAQFDGPVDTSDDDDDDDDDKDKSNGNDDSDNSDENMEEEPKEMEETEPLNSDDDLIEDECEDEFETNNIIACQFDKVLRHKNHWKFLLKDGIMHLKGEDYVFQKALGDAEF